MSREQRLMLSHIFIYLIIFLFIIVTYKISNPYAYPGIENRILYILALVGIAWLFYYAYDNYDYIISGIRRILGKVHGSRFAGFCKDIWQTVPPFIRLPISGFLIIFYTNVYKIPRFFLRDNGKYNSYLFLGLLLIIAIQSVVPVLEGMGTHLTIITIAVGIVTFYLNRDNFRCIEDEALEENRRELEFAQRYPRIDRMWGVRRGIRWMYREGIWYSGTLVILILAAFLIRIHNLTILYPYTDEYLHLIAAKQLLETGATDYTRAYFLTYIVSSLFQFFQPSLFIARLPGVFFGAITVIPIYLLGKKVSNFSAIISSWLWVISPWAIGVSRTLREYAIFPFFILFYILFIIYYIQRTVKIIEGDIKLNLFEIVPISVLFFPLVYIYYFDPSSSFKITLLFLVPLGFFGLYSLCQLSYYKKYTFHVNIILIMIGVILAYQFRNIDLIHFYPQFNESWLNHFFFPDKGTSMSWHYNMHLSFVFIIFIVFLGILYPIFTKNITGILIVLIFFLSLYFFTFHFDRYIRPRYIFYLLPFFIYIIGYGINFIYILIPKIKFKNIMLIIAILLLFNPFNAYFAITYNKHGYVPMTNEYHDDITDLKKVYNGHIENDDVIISSLTSMIIWYFDRPINDPNLIKWDYTDKNRFNTVSKVVSENNEGWIILDKRRNGQWSKGLPRSDFTIGKKEVKFWGNYGTFQVYRWEIPT